MRYLRKPIVSFLLLLIITLAYFSHPVHSASSQAESYFQQGRSDYGKLVRVTPTQSNRRQLIKCIRLFEYIAARYPKDPNADEALFSAGNLYLNLYRSIGYLSDRDGALASYQEVVDRYPNSRLADDAQYKIGELHEQDRNFYLAGRAYQGVIQKFPKGDMTQMAKTKLQSVKPAPPKPAPPVKKTAQPNPGPKDVSLNNVRHWSSPNYTRVVLDLDGMAPYTSDKNDVSSQLVIRLAGTRLNPSVLPKTEIKDGVVTEISIDREGTGGVKVTAEFNRVSRYRVFSLKEPFRVVLDFYKKTEEKPQAPPPAVPAVTRPTGQPPPVPTAAPQYRIKTIVIDPGHGGKDPGAIGPGGTKEKNVTLSIAKKLQTELKKNMNCKVILTRETDRYVDLEERTAIANMVQADLFVSIHANASKNRNSHGTETYFLSPSRSVDELETAARENMIAKASMDEIENDLAYILSDMQNTANVNDSSLLAAEVQRALVRGTRDQNSKVRDLGVKQAMFYVLLESRMPSVLVETAFISNQTEEKQLSSPGYQWSVAQSISSGIGSFVQENRLAYRGE